MGADRVFDLRRTTFNNIRGSYLPFDWTTPPVIGTANIRPYAPAP